MWLMAYGLWLVAEARPDRGRGGGVRGGLGKSGEATLPDASRERARQELQLSFRQASESRARADWAADGSRPCGALFRALALCLRGPRSLPGNGGRALPLRLVGGGPSPAESAEPGKACRAAHLPAWPRQARGTMSWQGEFVEVRKSALGLLYPRTLWAPCPTP